MSMKSGPKVRTIYAGEGADTAPRGKLDEAKQLAAAGLSPDEIWQRTGIVMTDEGARWEIDDSAARLKDYPAPGEPMTLEQALHHPALFEAYPDMRHSLIVEDPNMPEGQGAAYRKGIGPFLSRENIEATGQDILPFLLHELQHGVQFREGWQPGAALHNENYRNTLGEVEAYDTQARHRLSAGERRTVRPARLGRR